MKPVVVPARRADLRVGPMREADLPAVVLLERAAFGDKNRNEQHFRDEIERAWSRPWVLRDLASGDVYGFLLAWHVADELHVLDVAVHPDVRRQGHGLRLMHYALAYARENQIRLVLLEVRMSNAPAIALYEGLGFEKVNVRRAYYSDGEDGVEMQLLTGIPTEPTEPGGQGALPQTS